MTNELSEVYLGWLETQTGTIEQPKSYSGLLQLMFYKEFLWSVPNDGNRIKDGLEIRKEFLRETELQGDLGLCSVLEVLIGLSRRLAFWAGGEPVECAWQLIRNLELHKMTDPISKRKAITVDEILNNLIWRNYKPNGQGGFFPLIDSEFDQRKIEVWYQMAEYVGEMHPEYWGRR